ncbi:MAG: DUF2071 domain-containing protein [Bernardetiaceae bacterium]|jgi:hypothetical protein|nr:DUF2071 domain-containing protein [Bernardetiaceae bacterium]
MTTWLKNHPFAVEAHFRRSVVLTYALAPEHLAPLLPPCLGLDTHADRWGFVAIALVQTEGLRPRGLPRWLGNDFFLIGYRIFVRYRNAAGKRLRGLYILQSQTDRPKMEWLGNLFTHYRYTTVDIAQTEQGDGGQIASLRGGFSLSYRANDEAALPARSPFASWAEARRFAGPLPFTFSYLPTTQKVVIVEGVRQNWTPRPVEVLEHHSTFMDTRWPGQAVLANAFMIEDVPYHWKKGRTEQWKM